MWGRGGEVVLDEAFRTTTCWCACRVWVPRAGTRAAESSYDNYSSVSRVVMRGEGSNVRCQ